MNIENLEEVLITSGVLVAFVYGITNFLIKKTIDHTYKVKELYLEDKFKNVDRQITFLIENHKNTLQLLSYKENKLHDKRIEVIAELYGKLVSLQFALNDLTRVLKPTISNPKKEENIEKAKLESCTNLYNDFYLFYSKHIIYFSDKTCKPLDEIRSEYSTSLGDYASSKLFKDHDKEYYITLIKGASENIRTKIPGILAIIKNDFKSIIGSDTDIKKSN